MSCDGPLVKLPSDEPNASRQGNTDDDSEDVEGKKHRFQEQKIFVLKRLSHEKDSEDNVVLKLIVEKI